MRLLLEKEDINLNTPGAESHWTPLVWLGWAGYEKVVELLLQRTDIDPEIADTKHGLKPLQCSGRRSRGMKEWSSCYCKERI